jgi:hypothetical protein
MSKNKTSYDTFLAEILAAAPADQREALKATLSTDEVRKVGEPRVLAQDDYSRKMDEGRLELKTLRESLDAEVAEARTKINGWSEWYKTASTEFATTKGKLDRYETEFGALEGEGKPAKKFLTKEDIEADLAATLSQRDAFAIDTAVQLADLGDDYREKFNVRLNRKELIDFAAKNQLRLDVAYDRYIAPKWAEKQKTDFDKQIADAREEGARGERTKHNLPIQAGPTEHYTPSYQKDAGNLVSRNAPERVSAAVDDFNQLVSGR